jgi:surfactin family lipopeptide synthetase A/fengycin family lipopeptide synthetase D
VSGRDHADLEGQIGIFLNILPVKTEMNPVTDTCLTALLKVKESLFEAYRYQYYPFELIIDDVKGASGESRDIGINVLVQMQDDEEGPDVEFASGLTVEPYPFNVEVSQYELTFFIYSTGPGMSIKIEYQTALFKSSTINTMIDDYTELISLAGNNPDRPLADLPLCVQGRLDDDPELFLQRMQSIIQ